MTLCTLASIIAGYCVDYLLFSLSLCCAPIGTYTRTAARGSSRTIARKPLVLRTGTVRFDERSTSRAQAHIFTFPSQVISISIGSTVIYLQPLEQVIETPDEPDALP